MKALVLFALSTVAAAAMAAGPVAEIRISGNSTQAVVMLGSAAGNSAAGRAAIAQQNLASNTGDVSISGNSVQAVGTLDSVMVNTATANSMAQQSLSSNVGNVGIGGNSTQATLLIGSALLNSATGRGATAVQNVASNNACYTCTTTSR